MRRISGRGLFLLAGVALLMGCGGPHEIDERSATGAEIEESAPAEVEGAVADDEEPQRDPSDRR